MRAILVATGDPAGVEALRTRLASPMLPLVDRPILQHVVEHLVGLGYSALEILVARPAYRVRELLGDGTRWGATIRFHDVEDASAPYKNLAALLTAEGDGPILLGHADRLPSGLEGRPLPGDRGPLLICAPGERRGTKDRWTGWAWIDREAIDGLPAGADEEALYRRLSDANWESRSVEAATLLRSTSYAGLLKSHRDAIAGRGPGLLFSAREVEPKVWLSRDVSLHPSVKLVAPVYVGEGSKVREGAQIGPGTVLGAGCLVDRGSTVTGSVVFPNSYVGAGLDVDHAIIDRNLLVNVRLGTEVILEDEALLASLSGQFSRDLSGVASRLAAAIILSLAWPILPATVVVLKLIGSQRRLSTVERVRLPNLPGWRRWKTYEFWGFHAPGAVEEETGAARLLFRILPGLINVALGHLRLFGVRPRSAAEIRALPPDERSFLLRSDAGPIDPSPMPAKPPIEEVPSSMRTPALHAPSPEAGALLGRERVAR